ncbi:conserved hypothetical protein [Talaromyces stipitatus ATCC 10500]|uniref:Transcription factor domain-containing protein n=1 Tax=Talaromyces stipitatus (strain ATCC 10500 / CBS 375.48 / QM 6759 / NRRL 1006) TaxID=441959 RepID=B8MNZ7_TALSN|nr:uncharacterized protein TSTA_104520 [Talaromyces stipitatus ATCC 10500]EED14236.1 conserved hypothetical protein [Talaromyces stipitatus ATCC 10500]
MNRSSTVKSMKRGKVVCDNATDGFSEMEDCVGDSIMGSKFIDIWHGEEVVSKPTNTRLQYPHQQQQQHQLNNAVVASTVKAIAEENNIETLVFKPPKRIASSSDEGSDEGSIASDDSNNDVPWIRPALDIEIRKQHSPYIVDLVAKVVRQAPGLFVQGQSFFIHPQVYGNSLPRPVRDIHALCALYENDKDYQLSPVKLSTLLQRQIVSLIQTAKKTTDFEELVACVQALTLAQCLQLSEGNIRSPAVEKSLDILAALAHRMWSLVPCELPSSMSPWHAWMFGETVRRTIVFSHLVIAAFQFLTRGYACRTPFIDALPFDGRTYLWDARSEQDWAKYSTQSDFPMVSVIEYADLLQSGRALCFSSFEGLIIATCRGLDLPIHDPAKVMQM